MKHYISFCGINGAGKTTQIELLQERLEAETRREVVLVKNPGTTDLGDAVRDLVVNKVAGNPDAMSAIMLHCVAHRSTVKKVVIPALRRGAVVLEDRGAFCGRVYAGACHNSFNSRAKYAGYAREWHDMVVPRRADLNILLDIDARVSLQRLAARNRYESKPCPRQTTHRLADLRRNAYLSVAHQHHACFQVVDGMGAAATVGNRVWEAVKEGKWCRRTFPEPTGDTSWVRL